MLELPVGILGDILAKDFDCNFREVAAADQVTEVWRVDCIAGPVDSLADCWHFPWVVSWCPRGQEEEQDLPAGQGAGGEGITVLLTSIIIILF